MTLSIRSALTLSLMLTPVSVGLAKVHTVASPDGQLVATVEIVPDTDGGTAPVYSLSYRGKPLLSRSELGFDIDAAAENLPAPRVVDADNTTRDTIVKPLYGERNTWRDHYNQIELRLSPAYKPDLDLALTLRAYDAGVAFGYTFHARHGRQRVTIKSERTQFHLAGDWPAWEEHGVEGQYRRAPISQIRPKCETPLTVEIPDGPVMCITEANVVDYPRMWLSPVEDQPHALVSHLGSGATLESGQATPWRVVMVADTPGELLEGNDIIRLLCPPCAIKDTSWIRPGKAIRVLPTTTEAAMAYIPFAKAHGIDTIEFDAGWYGKERDVKADARTPRPDLDIKKVIAEAGKHGIGVVVYVNRIHLERDLDDLLPLYREWGIRGMKFGFVRCGTQATNRWLIDAVRKAAEHRIVVDIHDAYRPSGLSRTYPNLLTQEGIRGNEHMPTATHSTILPFARFVGGAGDHTVCYYEKRLKTTHGHQLALLVIVYSPMQFVFWYDRPDEYQGEPEIELFAHVPTVWDDTRVVLGKIGEFASIARRKGDAWFVGTITNEDARALDVPLAFLPAGKTYLARIYGDAGPDHPTRTNIRIDRCLVTCDTVVSAKLLASGGQAIWLTPADDDEIQRHTRYEPTR